MEIDLRWALNYSVVFGKEGLAWYNYPIIWLLYETLDMPIPFQNPDKTLSSLLRDLHGF